ncbi:MAG: hypothetical protein H0T73_06050 [Ardenticatenales bacterium]|nr:hypothetical protein [Ardenticatenales bacterium]
MSNLGAVNYRAYLATHKSNKSTLQAIDLTIPTAPVMLANYTGFGGSSLAIEGWNNYLYIFTGDKVLQIVDFSNPLSPILRNTIQLPLSSTESVQHTEMHISKDHLYLLVSTTAPDGELLALDLSNPVKPRLVASYHTPYHLWDMVVREPYVYLLRQSGLTTPPDILSILDVSEAMTLTEVFSYSIGSEIRTLAVAGNYTYLGGTSLETWDIHDLTAATRVHTTTMPESGILLDSFIQGEHLYGVTATGGYLGKLYLFDLSNPEAPLSNQVATFPVMATKAEAQGDYIYVAAGEAGFFIFHDPIAFEVTSRLYLPIMVR